MKWTYQLTLKVVASGILGMLVFFVSLYLISALFPASNGADVVSGFAAALLLLLAVGFSMLLSGALATFLAFPGISSSKDALYISLVSGIVTAIGPLLIGILIGGDTSGVVAPCLVVTVASLLASVIGGYVVMLMLSWLKSHRAQR